MATNQLRLALAATLALFPIAAPARPGPPPGSAQAVQQSYINLRLSPQLGKGLPAVRAALVGLPVRLAEPADYELTTKRNFPQTLIVTDLRQLGEDWDTDFAGDDESPRLIPRTFELGNLVIGDFRGALVDLVARVLRAKTLLALKTPSGAAGIDTCMAWPQGGDLPLASGCHPPDASGMLTAVAEGMGPFGIEVRNRSNQPRYVAVLTVEPWLGIQQLAFANAGSGKPLAPGANAQTDVIDLLNSMSESVTVVTISSPRPIDAGAFVQPSLVQYRNELACGGELPGCELAPPEADISDWSISMIQQKVERERLAQMGGGASVLDGMALWMAEIYSTVPFTKAEIAADALKPVKDREHLAERNEAELNHRCGGTRIAPDLVVTAAHCVAQGHYAGAGMVQVLDERRVRVGTPHLGWGGTTYAIAGVAVPTGYVAGRQEDDIAVLLIKPDRDTGLVEQVTLAVGSRPLAVGTRLTGYGWGYTGAVAPAKNPMFNLLEELQHNPDRLQFGEMVALGRGKCQQLLRRPVGGGMVCLVAPATAEGTQPERNVFTCRGDSGGPLVRGVGLNAELVGVTSWSLGCGYKDFPSVYTNVTKYGRWIAAARHRLKPGAAIRVDEKGAPSLREGRPQGR